MNLSQIKELIVYVDIGDVAAEDVVNDISGHDGIKEKLKDTINIVKMS